MNTQPAHTIILSPIEVLDTALLDQIIGELMRVYGYPVEIMPLLDNLDFAFDRHRRQYHSTLILEALDRKAPSNALKILGITRQDLFIPILTHVYGEAQLGGRASIISVHRLKEGIGSGSHDKEYHARVVKEAVHELGHTFNLRHCKDPGCIMHYCHSVADVDRKSNNLCRYCSTLLKDELERLMSG
ncbi:MAG: archaemetzincin family Zn-dependent metalloprotease [Deltaproteobacteria bacterium]|nr:archaemetzincin family Zn-dependent metalloprotease [Deltaproteobacteria bacterium]